MALDGTSVSRDRRWTCGRTQVTGVVPPQCDGQRLNRKRVLTQPPGVCRAEASGSLCYGSRDQAAGKLTASAGRGLLTQDAVTRGSCLDAPASV